MYEIFKKRNLSFLDGRNKFPIIKCGHSHSYILFGNSKLNHLFSSENGTLFCCGKNYFGQLGLKDREDRKTFQKVPFDKQIIQISAGVHYILVLTGLYFFKYFNFLYLENFHIYSCGYNKFGQLGLNDTTNRSKLKWISSLNGKKIIQIECGDDHSIALTGKHPNY